MTSSTLFFGTLLLVTLAAAQDPTCSTGVRGASACCAAGCEKCGGADCGARGRMKKLKCCIFAIKSMNANCLTSGPPCMITTMDTNFTAINDNPDPKCEMGLRKNRACCPKECSTCGGKGCRKRGALINSQCCPVMIKASTRGCMDTGAPCTLFRASNGTSPMVMEPTPMPMGPMEMEPTPMPMEPMGMEPTHMPMGPMEMEPTPMPMEPMGMESTPMPMEPMGMEPTPMPREMPVESPMEPMEMPVESPMEPMETPLPRVCSNMRKKFIGGCFCYLVFSENVMIKSPRPFRMFCRKTFGTKRQILSMSFSCRRFVNGASAEQKRANIIRRINTLIPICNDGIPMIEERS